MVEAGSLKAQSHVSFEQKITVEFFLTQLNSSDEFYLREWAVKMDVPILSIDYSLAPEAPFPRALEEVFYAYCWILKNIELLGSTGENIVFAGDSAGGNLNTACIVKCIEMGIKKPKGLFNAYTPFLVNFASTPARFLSLVDPLLPYGFIMRVFKSYGANTTDTIETSSNSENVLNNKNHIDHGIVEDVRDDNQEKIDLMSPDSNKNLEAMWLKIKSSEEDSEWQTNLGSIRETPSEEPSSPFDFGNGSAKFEDAEETSEEKVETDMDKVEIASLSEKKPSQFTNSEKYGNLIPPAPEDEFVFSVPKNQYLSPYWASAETLKEFPATKILTTVVDPCIDDCIEFSKKLKSFGVDIHLDILEGLNHGFLNFAQVKSCQTMNSYKL